MDWVSVVGVVIGKIGYVVKKRTLDKDKNDDETELQFLANWFVKSPVSTALSLIMALGVLHVLPQTEDTVQSLVQAISAAMASDSLANQKGGK